VVVAGTDALALGAEASFGLRRDDLIVKDVAPALLREHLDTYQAWRASRDAAVAAASAPSIRIVTATECAAGLEADLQVGPGAEVGVDIGVSVEIVEGAAARPGGARFGSLVHALLADAPLMAPELLAKLADAHGRVLGAEPAEVEAACDVVARVLSHPVMIAAAAAAKRGECYREMPMTWLLDDRTLVEGTVDLAYASGAEMVVVDFKTDRELDGALDRYRRQVQIYAAAVASATGRPARAVLIKV
jgi:ATP-dependent helicase/nuclease subunit A